MEQALQQPPLTTTRREKSAEVDAFTNLHGWSFADACETVCLNPRRYIPGERPISHSPTPGEIERIGHLIMTGQIIICERERLTRALEKERYRQQELGIVGRS